MDDAQIALHVVRRIRPHLAGRPPNIQGAVLAELLATWLRGHHAETPERTMELRAELLGHLLMTASRLSALPDC
jgi:hypothetical protein